MKPITCRGSGEQHLVLQAVPADAEHDVEIRIIDDNSEAGCLWLGVTMTREDVRILRDALNQVLRTLAP
jgi:hypothetical protein